MDQDVVATGEGLLVLRGVDLVLSPVDRDDARHLEERPQDGDLPERVLAQQPRPDRQRTEDQQRVHQAVDVVPDQDERAVQRDQLLPHHLDALEEDPQEEPNQGAESAVGGAHPSSRRLAACHASAAARPRFSFTKAMPMKPRTKKAAVESIATLCEPAAEEMAPKINGPTM